MSQLLVGSRHGKLSHQCKFRLSFKIVIAMYNPNEDNPYRSKDPADLQATVDSDFFLGRLAIGLLGGVVGGAAGYFVYKWALSQGFYALAIPGAFLGFGFGLAGRRRNLTFGIICLVLAFGLSLFAEWSTFPFKADPSLWFFMTHLHLLKPLTWVMIAIGSIIAFTTGRGRG